MVMRLGSATAGQADRAHALVTQQEVGRRTVLAVGGEIDLDSVGVLSASVEAALAGGAAELWIDLTHTRFMDSSGLHVLLDTRSRVRDLNRQLAIICPPGPCPAPVRHRRRDRAPAALRRPGGGAPRRLTDLRLYF